MIIIFGACQPLGHAAAIAFADKGARVVLIDDDPKALDAICAQNPDWIEALAIEDIEGQMVAMLKEAWGNERIDLVINLMPMAKPRDISAQMRILTAILRTTLRGLVAGQGSVISVAAQPTDPLAFVAHGMVAALGAASEALASALSKKNVAVHCVNVPRSRSGQALDTLMFLGSPAGRAVQTTTFNVDNPSK